MHETITTTTTKNVEIHFEKKRQTNAHTHRDKSHHVDWSITLSMSRIILVKVNVKWARVHPFVQSVGWSIVLYYIEKIWLWIWANRLFLNQRQNKCQRRTPHTRSQKNVSIWSEYSVALSSISSSICYYLFNPADSACFFLFLSIFLHCSVRQQFIF